MVSPGKQVTVTWDVTLCSLVGVLMLTGNMLSTGFSITLAYFYIAFHPSKWTCHDHWPAYSWRQPFK